jgi:protein involved in polysaccharide export with SLBB domain
MLLKRTALALVVGTLPALAQEPAMQARKNAEPERSAGYSSSNPGTNSMAVLDIKRKLQVGDQLSYRVIEERSDSQNLTVNDSGDVEVPLIGRVSASGKTCRQLAEQIKSELEKDYFHHATVIIGLNASGTRNRGTIYLMGPVRNQGPMEIPLEDHFTLSKAILRAGGFADFANGTKVKLVRKNEAGEPQARFYNIADILKGSSGEDPEVKPDDLIVVPEKFINF